MILIDTHAHLYADEFNDDRDLVIGSAINAGVHGIILPNIDEGSIQGLAEITRKYPQYCFGLMGLHPCSVRANFQEQLNIIKSNLFHGKFVGIGETGIDLFHDTTFKREQEMAFEIQACWAGEMDLPLIIHTRKSHFEVIEIVKKVKQKYPRLTGIFHCFAGTRENAFEILDLGFYLGIGGVLTFKNSGLDQAIKDVPLENLVLETDSPYLAPMPFRGKRNQSGYLTFIAEKLAAVKDCPLETIAEKTTNNAKRIFKLN